MLQIVFLFIILTKDSEYDLEKLVMDSLFEPDKYYEEGQREEIKKKIIKNLEKIIAKLKNS